MQIHWVLLQTEKYVNASGQCYKEFVCNSVKQFSKISDLANVINKFFVLNPQPIL